MTQQEFEEYEADEGEYREEFRIRQASPVVHTWQAYVKIKVTAVLEFKKIYEGFSAQVQQFVQWITFEEHATFYKRDGLDRQAQYIHISMQPDRNYAEYGYIYRAIKALAPFLENCRFFIAEIYSIWVDEYQINNGQLIFQRHMPDEESDDYFKNQAFRDLHDIDMRKLAASLLAKEAAWNMNDINVATANLDMALELDAKNTDALCQYYLLYRAQRNYEQARLYIDRMEITNSTHCTSYPKGIICFTLHDYTAAIHHLSLVETDIDFSEPDGQLVNRKKLVHLLLAYSLLEVKNANNAGNHLSAYTQLVVEQYNQKAYVNFQPFRDELGYTQQYSQVLDAWVGYIERVYAKTEKHPAIAAELLDWAAYFNEDTQVAEKYYDKAIQWHHCDGEAYFLKGQLRDKIGQGGGLPFYLQALEINPHHAGALAQLGEHALQTNQNRQAIAFFLKFREVAAAREIQHAFSCSIDFAAYRRCSSYNVQTYTGLLVNALYEEGNRLLYRLHQYAEAEECFDKILALYPSLQYSYRQFEGACVGKSNVFAYQKEYDKAFNWAEKALTINPASSYAWSAKGSSLNNLGFYAEAINCYDNAIALQPGYFHPYYCKACTLALTGGNRGEIYDLIRKVLELDPSQKEMIQQEPDFQNLHNDPLFEKLFGERNG